MELGFWKQFLRDYLDYPPEEELPSAVVYVAEQMKAEHDRDGGEREDSAFVSNKSASDISVGFGDTGYYNSHGIPKKFIPVLSTYRRVRWGKR